LGFLQRGQFYVICDISVVFHFCGTGDQQVFAVQGFRFPFHGSGQFFYENGFIGGLIFQTRIHFEGKRVLQYVLRME
jgi:hypothetical protein